MTDQLCRVCDLAVAECTFLGDRDAFRVTCQRCGSYRISGTLQGIGFSSATPAQRAALMAALREASDKRVDVLLLTDNWQQLAAPFLAMSIPQKLRRLLEFMGDRSGTRAGTVVEVEDHLEFPRFAATDSQEYQWLKRVLLKQGLVELSGTGLVLTMEGWDAYRPSRGGVPRTCFVAMAFDKGLDAAYEAGIKPAVTEDCGFLITRVDKVQHNDNINDRIIADLRSCQFVVADFTLHRNGVYFEAGFALGLGRQVVWTCRDDSMSEAHFDTRPYNHVVWKDPAQLRERLAARIQATVQP